MAHVGQLGQHGGVHRAFKLGADHGFAGGAGGQLGHRAVGHQLAPADDEHAGAQGRDFGQYVGAENDGFIFAHLADELADFQNLVGVEAGGGLVEDEHVGVVDEGLGQAHALPVALAERANLLVLLAAQAHATHQLGHAGAQAGAAQPVHRADEFEVLVHVHIEVERVVLGQVAHVPAHV